MKEVMNDITFPNQSVFLGGRQSIGRVLIANECIDEIMERGNSGVLCKLDLEKANDRVNWEFLDYMLSRLGFENKWCEWLKKCYGSASFSNIFNGASVEYIHGSRGIC